MDNLSWICPICNSTDYWTLRGEDFEKPGEVHHSYGIEPVSGYECKGCGVRFEDPEKFCKKNNDVISASMVSTTAP